MATQGRLIACAMFVLAAAGDPGAASAGDTPPPRVTNELTRVGLRCAIASVYYLYDSNEFPNRLQTSILASPDGTRFAVVDPRGARILELHTGAEQVIEGVRPLLWSQDSRSLYVMDYRLRYYTFTGGKLTRDTWLESVFGEVLREDEGQPRQEIHIAGHGLIAVRGIYHRLVVANVETRRSFSIGVGWRRLTPRSPAEVKIGWNAVRHEPALFVAHQTYDGMSHNRVNPHEVVIVNHVDVYRPDGTLEFTADVPGMQVGLIPLRLGDHTLILSRQGEYRCVNALARDGHVTAHQACETDLEFAYLDRGGEMLAAKTFLESEPHNELPFGAPPSEVAGARLVAMLADGDAMYLLQKTGDGADEVVRVGNRKVKQRVPVRARECIDRESFPQGVAIRAPAADGFTSQGFLFSPPASVPTKGLVLNIHGGPREAVPNRLGDPLDRALIERGYAVAAVNYRGSPGYGRELLEKSYGAGFSGMVDDVEAIRRAAAERLRLPGTLPVFVHGSSYGGFIALKVALHSPTRYRAFIIDSGVCKVRWSARDLRVHHGRQLSLRNVLDPDSGVHLLRLATNLRGEPMDVDLCARKIPGDSRLLIIHARGDPNAPFADIESFSRLQDSGRMLTAFGDGQTHSPMMSISANPAVFTQVVDAMQRFLESPVPVPK